ncbi:MAG: AraC family transcriptional regulator [Thiotrichales bacterium]|nr:AraC family transcriptional regulator [Thiotrichales bacterium]
MALTFSAQTSKLSLKLIESYGINPSEILKKLQIDPKRLNDPNARLPYSTLDDIWAEAATQIQDPAFGLKAVECWHPSQMGALGYAWLSSENLKNALGRFQRYSRVVTEGAYFEIEETPKYLSLILHYRSVARQLPYRTDGFMAIMLAMCRANFGKHFQPAEIHLKHSAPEDTSAFEALFKCPVFFGARDNRFVIHMKDALEMSEGAQPQLAKLHDQVMIEYLAKMDRKNIVEQVKSEIIKQLPNGNVTDTTVGQALHINDRTLQRRLKEQNTTFKTLMNEVREDLAATYIKDSNLSLSEISFLLGFGNISSFSRAYKRWTGKPPSHLRGSN